MIRKMISNVARKFTTVTPLGIHDPNYQSYRVSDAGELVGQETALSLSTVWACVNLIAGTIATIPLKVYVKENGIDQEVTDHSLSRILNLSPNSEQTAVDMWEYSSASIELWGSSYARIRRNGSGEIVALEPINPSQMMVRRDKSSRLEYAWTDAGRSFRVGDSEIFHVRGFGGNPLGGMSTIQFGRQSLGNARAAEKASGKLFSQGARPSGALTFDTWLTDEQYAVARERLTEQFEGSAGSGRPFILEGGTKWEPLAMNPDDAQMLETRRFSVEELCRFFGVPPHMIGHTEKSTAWGTGLSEQTRGFLIYNLRRRLKRIEQAGAKQLLTPEERGRGIHLKFDLRTLLRADPAARSSMYEVWLRNGIATINEVRALENLEPIDGGDVSRIQMQNIPITEAGNQP